MAAHAQRLLLSTAFSTFHGALSQTCIIWAAEVLKKDGTTMFTAKAWNGRVICQWLSACLRDAASTQNYVGRCDVPLPLMSSCASLVRFQVDCARVNEEQQARCYDVLNMMPHFVKAVTAFTVDGLVSWGKCILCRLQSLGSIPWHVVFCAFPSFPFPKP